MPRKGEVPKRDSLPDPKYTDAPLDVRKRVTKFMNTVMTRLITWVTRREL